MTDKKTDSPSNNSNNSEHSKTKPPQFVPNKNSEPLERVVVNEQRDSIKIEIKDSKE